MDEFVAFYGSDGNVAESGKYSPQVVKTTKIVWTLLHESEDLMLQHGTLDEITAEQNLVQQTYQGMRDQATKTCVVRMWSQESWHVAFVYVLLFQRC